jgi:hypothetical protein
VSVSVRAGAAGCQPPEGRGRLRTPSRSVRSLAAGALGLGLLLGPLAPDAAAQLPTNVPFFEPGDAQRLSAELAEARRQQGICYGWSIRVSGGGEVASEVGSDAGPGIPVRQGTPAGEAACDRWAEADIEIVYTDESSEFEDYATVGISTGPSSDWQPSWQDLGITEADLLGDRDYAAMTNLISGLPLLAAQDGVAAALTLPEAQPSGPTDEPYGNPTPDLLRDSGPAIVFFGLLALAGGLWFVVEVRRQRRRTPVARGSGAWPGSPHKPR